jgi:hypothetical protein
MIRTSAVSPLAPEFDEFLFAPIGEDGKGMVLTVLSALARLDLDPWQEAAELAHLPITGATEKLASLISSFSQEQLTCPEPETIATRLIALLPHQSRVSAGTSTKVPHTRSLVDFPMAMVFAAIFMAFALGSQFIMENRQPPAQTGTAQVATAQP